VFQGLNDSGMTVVMVTHELDVARFARRTIVMRDGRIRRDEPVTARLFAGPEVARLDAEEKAVDLAP
jgi:putative ABC transport system ATP-binding protein